LKGSRGRRIIGLKGIVEFPHIGKGNIYFDFGDIIGVFEQLGKSSIYFV
jgi:hypothetical protein